MTLNFPQLPDEILTDNKELRRLLKMSRATAERREKSDPTFPRRIRLPGCRKIYRLRADVIAYIDAAATASQKTDAEARSHAAA